MIRLNLIVLILSGLSSLQIVSAQIGEEKIPDMIVGGLTCGKATNLVKPAYPQEAKAAGVSGSVKVLVIVGKDGKVESAEAVSGHPLLNTAAEKAALNSSFSPMTIKGIPVKVKGILVYKFVSDESRSLSPLEVKAEKNDLGSGSKAKKKPVRPTRVKSIFLKRIKKKS
jgi:TonB family protein